MATTSGNLGTNIAPANSPVRYNFYWTATRNPQTSTTVSITFTIETWLRSSSSTYGYSIDAYCYFNSQSNPSHVNIKGTETWSGTTKHTKTVTMTTTTTASSVSNVRIYTSNGGSGSYDTGWNTISVPSYTNPVTTPTVTCSVTQGLNTLGASLTVTNTGGASIQSQSIKLYSDNACTNLVGTINGTSGTFTGLTPNTTYYAKAQAYNGTYTGYSSVVTKATYNKATISTAPNIDHGDTLTVTYANPSSSSLKIALYTSGGTVLCADRTCTGTSYTFTFTDTELDKMYKEYGNSNSFSPYVILRTANTYYDTKTITITLKGNQKTIRDKVSGSWKRGKVYVKVSGTWKKGVVWTKVSGTWKRGI